MTKATSMPDHGISITDPKAIVEIGKQFDSPSPKLTKTTFNLTMEGYGHLNELVGKRGSTVAAVLTRIADILKDDTLRETIAEDCVKNPIQEARIRRSYAVDRQTLSALQHAQKSIAALGMQVSRDDLTERTARLICHIVTQSKEVRLEKVKRARELYREFGSVFAEWCAKMGEVLSDYPDHGIHQRLTTLGIIYDNLGFAMDDEIEKGIPVDPSGL